MKQSSVFAAALVACALLLAACLRPATGVYSESARPMDGPVTVVSPVSTPEPPEPPQATETIPVAEIRQAVRRTRS